MFVRFVDLPVELALEIIELAGWSSVTRSARWVAAAVLANRAFDRVLRPILYRTVRVTPTNLAYLSRVASRATPNSHFTLTRRVILNDEIDYRAAIQLVGLFPHAQCITCDIPSYLALRHDPAFAPDELILTSQYDAHDVFGWFALYFTGRRLCIVEPLTPAVWFTNDFDGLCLTHVMLHDCHEVIERLLRIPALGRIVLLSDAGSSIKFEDNRVHVSAEGVSLEDESFLSLWAT
ncbi:hypothetical protein AURDEDRAFT_164556 [Auricularia subglabra TFB-10046 SS5]|nr:hypothetical protein AURDEDRAFT_164556 [Auricularia subglabra TFB-10046 SS5]